jgi:Fe-S-cluster-containing dehydrogenase component/formate-dependent nitrite reductase membrane component NrfD
MQYGFLIDHRRCIGCHACTVACKSENEVPVGSFRTWVQYAEKGVFPDVRRHFAVLRCNHCTSAPCVTICPVNALEKRPDGIVDLDRDECIGCRACMQACPYDALYLNEDRGTVEKCHFCAHRVERKLEPACVTVCPEEAIVHGDVDEPRGRIGRMIGELDTEVRRPGQRTGPNVHYVGHEPTMLQPGSTARPEMFLWSERPQHKSEPWPGELPLEPDMRTVLDAGHRVEWGWTVALYLVTKGIAAGTAMLAPFAAALGLTGFAADYLPELLALLFTLVTTGLLAGDLARPRMFLRVMTRANPHSWLVRGAWVLSVFTLLLGAALAARWAGMGVVADSLRWVHAATGILVAGYTAFLFAQCEGRDLWQSHWLLPHLVAQAVLCGCVCLLPFARDGLLLGRIFLVAAALHLIFSLAERYRRHSTANARQAAAFLGRLRLGALRPLRDGLLLGVVLAGVLIPFAPVAALAAALSGLLLYEWAYVRAAQLPPLS